MRFAAAVLHLLCGCTVADAISPVLNVTASGPPIDVWAAVDTLHRCHMIDVPDIPARAFQDLSGVNHMIVGSTSYHHTPNFPK